MHTYELQSLHRGKTIRRLLYRLHRYSVTLTHLTVNLDVPVINSRSRLQALSPRRFFKLPKYIPTLRSFVHRRPKRLSSRSIDSVSIDRSADFQLREKPVCDSQVKRFWLYMNNTLAGVAFHRLPIVSANVRTLSTWQSLPV